MLDRLLRWLFGARTAPVGTAPSGFDTLNRQAPLKAAPQPVSTVIAADEAANTYLCREAVLGRDQRIAGYHFLLQESTRNRIRASSRRVRHVYTEVLIRNLMQADVGSLLEHRLLFIDIPDSFADNPSLTLLPAAKSVLVLEHLSDTDAPSVPELLQTTARLRQAGFRIGVPDPVRMPALAPLLPQADFVVLDASGLDAEHGLLLSARIAAEAPAARLLVRALPGLEDFRFCLSLGALYFQGPFITRREDWSSRQVSPSVTHLARLLARLRADGDTSEIVALLKQDAALTVRLLRYINAAASGLQEQVSSIERAMTLLGRAALQRWVTLLICSTDTGNHNAAALETALVRARMMELLGQQRSAADREALFLTGLLSLIDVILQVPMERAITSLAASPEIEAAVLHGEGPYAAALQLASACEGGDRDRLSEAAERWGLDPAHATSTHIEALAWAMAAQQ